MKTPMSSDSKLTKDKELSAFVPASKRLPKPLTLKRLSVSSDTLKALRTWDYDDWSEEWDAYNPEFRALFILKDGASVARI
ncbi:hypothetical protein Tco_0616492 [Tanacetum coccineum]